MSRVCENLKMYWRLVELFFGVESLQTSLHIMIMCIQSKNRDAVVYTCSSATKNPVCVCFTEDGLVPFSATPDLLIPYDLMSREQLECSLTYCKNIEDEGMYISGSKMGHGFFIQSIDINRHYISHSLILEKTNDLLRQLHTSPDIVCLVMHQLTGECIWHQVENVDCQ